MEWALGVDIGGTNVKTGFVNREGTLKGFRSFPTPRTKSGILDVPKLANEVAGRFGEAPGGGKVAGAGIGVPGLLNEERTVVRYAVNLGLADVPLPSLLQERWNVPVALDSDVIMGALGEKLGGAAAECGRFLYVGIGTGVGACLIERDGVYRNPMGGPLNIGHMAVYPDGIPCACGNQGCLERYVSGLGLVERYGAEPPRVGGHNERASPVGGNERTVERICALADQGDPLARRLLTEAGRALGIAFANLFQLFGECPIVVGGGLSRIRALMLESAVRELARRGRSALTHPPEVRPAAQPDRAGVMGAGSAAFARFGPAE
ncbi:ROK family protein [Cohnella hongkongensis]|uniref:ROK family protein n=1 Tax=Cohnella hongkongensis TaxID=178337 RepID=A0ABV9F6L5_9BACL